MSQRSWFVWAWLPLFAASFASSARAPACCPAPMRGNFVVNADQTVILIWNPDTQTQHFIRKASFKSDARDVGFIVPTPAEPELAESDNKAFSSLAAFTAPKVKSQPRPKQRSGFGCILSDSRSGTVTTSVQVLQEKEVAGFNAVVLEAESADALSEWLTKHGYEFSPEIAAWAEPYVEQGWKFTALKVADEKADATNDPNATPAPVSLNAPALRISFKTDRPLFPYREPEMTAHAEKLAAQDRLLRIYFLSNQRYEGELTKDSRWTGKVVWSKSLSDDQCRSLHQQLALPEKQVSLWWLTEFEDRWPYRPAPADLYFAASSDHTLVERPAQVAQAEGQGSVDVMPMVILAALVMPVWWTRARRS